MKMIMLTESKLHSIIREVIEGVWGENDDITDKNDFNINDLQQQTGRDVFDYCKKCLGDPIGKGSARAVFKINDSKAIKVAYGYSGIEQNKVEAQASSNNDCFCKVFRKAPDYSWLICEYAQPITEDDFVELTGIDWAYFQLFLSDVDLHHHNHFNQTINDYYFEKLLPLVKSNPILNGVYSFIEKNQILSGDLKKLDSWGSVMRNGKPTLVVIDGGRETQ
jgi:hypothetical protein